MSRGRSMADAGLDVRQYLVSVAAALGDALGDALSGLYLRGSLATGSFHRERSDIDAIAVVTRRLAANERERLARLAMMLDDVRPAENHLELGVIQKRFAQHFEHPLPVEIYYTASLRERFRQSAFDFDAERTFGPLALFCFEARERGVTLVGPPPNRMFGPVPWHAYIDQLHALFDADRARLETDAPSVVLNACRTLHGATAQSMTALNKDEAALWALETVPRMYHSIVNDALQIYRGTKTIEDVVPAERDVIALREFVRERSQPSFDRAADTGEEEA